MDILANTYQIEAMRTCEGMTQFVAEKPPYSQLINGVMGLNGEAGECIDIVKKYLFQGHTLDAKHLVEELGDVLWYVAVTADALGLDLGDIMKRNINKLRIRYPEGFDTERSVNRNDS